MSGKRQRLKIDAKREAKRKAERSLFPEGAVIADPSKQVPNNSCGAPVLFYVDKPFTCIDCGKSEIWSAQQQQWYYEVARGSLYATAVRCRECRKVHAGIHSGHGDPNPIKHEGTLMKRVQTGIAAVIAETGFKFVSKSHPPTKGTITLDYERDDLLLTCWYHRNSATLIAETMDRCAQCSEMVRVAFNAPQSGLQVVDRIEEFSAAVTRHLLALSRSDFEQ
ncbi:MAG: zinc-ribbon domain-containing protein [Planctomycetaceae bacterium]|nr:zinc-ribbon domain-containing protein [Planctomycetaceae bacterium]